MLMTRLNGLRPRGLLAVRSLQWVGFILVLSATGGCKDLVSNPSVPDGVQSPNTYLSRQGALDLTRGASSLFQDAMVDMIIQTGLITDEFTLANRNLNPLSQRVLFDTRSLTENDRDLTYERLHKLRGQARLARAVLAAYAPDVSSAVRGQLYAFEAYADVLLADLFCSGIPLSTVDFGGDFTYAPPSTSAQVYAQAVALFDSALALVSDTAGLQTLATVGKGRALLALGRYDEAAAAVANVTDTAAYRIRIGFTTVGIRVRSVFFDLTVSDREGANGAPFISSKDPRTKSDTVRLSDPGGGVGQLVRFPNKYQIDSTWLIVAGGIEARLIEAERELHNGQTGPWLSMLNALRTDGSYSGIETTPDGGADTVWNAGSGGIARLGPLQDPGAEASRIDLMFSERAMWLFATVHRQGDLRRLVRVYGRAQNQVYPTGEYGNTPIGGGTRYSNDITVPIPASERRNPNFRGCLTRD